MFSRLFSLFSLKRTFSSTEANTSVDEGSGRPTKRVRIEEPSKEDLTEQNTPVQDACTTTDEEKEVLDEILPQGVVVEGEETLAIGARLREGTPNRVQDLHQDAEVQRLAWEAAMAEAREEGRRQVMVKLQNDWERVHEERRRRPSPILPQQPRDVSSSVLAVPSVSPTPSASRPATPPSFGIPLIPQLRQPNDRPREFELNPWVFGSKPSLIDHSVHIFVQPPPAQPRRSTCSRRPAPSPSSVVDESSPETILASLRQLREQSGQTPSRSSDAEDEELADDDSDSGDEDLPLFTAMMQAGNPTPPHPEHHRDYPVYAEDLDLPEDQPQAREFATPMIIIEPRIMPVVQDEEDDDDETEEERLARLVREGEAEEGVDLE